jgi:RNA polymerase sigma-70 factor, ECF subfamily
MAGNPRGATELLVAWRKGDQDAFDGLIPVVYDELHRIARRCMAGERAGQTLQATALVNEAFEKLIDVRRINWQNRAHFLAMAARVMRRVLVDVARARSAERRGGGQTIVSFDEEQHRGDPIAPEVMRLNDALDALARLDDRKSRVVELRFFGGLTLEETAEALGVSSKTVARDWEFARAWLQREMT